MPVLNYHRWAEKVNAVLGVHEVLALARLCREMHLHGDKDDTWFEGSRYSASQGWRDPSLEKHDSGWAIGLRAKYLRVREIDVSESHFPVGSMP
jgi:hypothetical protein